MIKLTCLVSPQRGSSGLGNAAPLYELWTDILGRISSKPPRSKDGKKHFNYSLEVVSSSV